MFVPNSLLFFSNYFFQTNYWNGPRIDRFEHVEGFLVLMTKLLSKYESVVLSGSFFTLPHLAVEENTWPHFLEPKVSGRHLLILSRWKFEPLSSSQDGPAL